jgi:S-adenosylmethionine synthetase
MPSVWYSRWACRWSASHGTPAAGLHPAYVKDSYDLTPQGIIQRLGLLDVDYNKVSAYGHFGKPSLPWEE